MATARGTSACTAWPTARRFVRLPRGRGPSRHLQFSPDGRYLIAAYAVRGAGWHFTLWDIGGDKAPRKLFEAADRFFHFSADGRRVAIRLSESAVGLYDPATGELRKRLTVGSLGDVGEFHPDGRRLVLFDKSPRTLRLLDVESGEEVWSHSFEAEIDSVAWRGDGRLLAASGSDHRIYVWDMAANRLQSVLEGHQNTVVGLQFTHAGSLLISSSWDGGCGSGIRSAAPTW